MSKLLDSAAVGRQDGANAKELLQAYISTSPAMEQTHAAELTKTQKPRGLGAADQIEPR